MHRGSGKVLELVLNCEQLFRHRGREDGVGGGPVGACSWQKDRLIMGGCLSGWTRRAWGHGRVVGGRALS